MKLSKAKTKLKKAYLLSINPDADPHDNTYESLIKPDSPRINDFIYITGRWKNIKRQYSRKLINDKFMSNEVNRLQYALKYLISQIAKSDLKKKTTSELTKRKIKQNWLGL